MSGSPNVSAAVSPRNQQSPRLMRDDQPKAERRKRRVRLVELAGGGNVQVGPISWEAWTAVKTEIVSSLGWAAQRMIENSGEEALGSDWKLFLIRNLHTVLSEINDAVTNATPEFVRGCCRGELPEDLDALDHLELRRAAMEVNDLARLVELEKNFVAGIVEKIVPASIGEPATTPPGGSSGKASSPTHTDGGEAT